MKKDLAKANSVGSSAGGRGAAVAVEPPTGRRRQQPDATANSMARDDSSCGGPEEDSRVGSGSSGPASVYNVMPQRQKQRPVAAAVTEAATGYRRRSALLVD